MPDLYTELAASLQANPAPGATVLPPAAGGAAPTLLQPGTGVDMNVFSVPPVNAAPAPAGAPATPAGTPPVAAAPAAPTGVDTAALAQAVLAMQATQAQMMQNMQALATPQVAPAPVAPPTPPALPTLNSAALLSADEITRFGDMAPALDRIIQQAVANTTAHMQQHYIAPLQSQLEATATSLNTIQAASNEQGSRTMTTMLNSAVPELSAIVHTPQWQARLRERLPLTGETVGETLVRAYRSGALDVIKAHVAEFRATNAPAPAPALAAPAGAPGTAQPNPTPAGVPLPAGGAPSAGVVDMARVDDLMRKYAAGQITPDAYNAMVAQVMTAAVAGASHVH